MPYVKLGGPETVANYQPLITGQDDVGFSYQYYQAQVLIVLHCHTGNVRLKIQSKPRFDNEDLHEIALLGPNQGHYEIHDNIKAFGFAAAANNTMISYYIVPVSADPV